MKKKKIQSRIDWIASSSKPDYPESTHFNSNLEEFEDLDPGLLKALAFFVDFNKQYQIAEKENRLPDFLNQTINWILPSIMIVNFQASHHSTFSIPLSIITLQVNCFLNPR